MDRISDLRTSLCKSLSRDVVEHVAASVAEYPNDIPQLIRLLDDTDNRVAWQPGLARNYPHCRPTDFFLIGKRSREDFSGASTTGQKGYCSPFFTVCLPTKASR